ncbi:MAG: T9SS type A sorting domain-containing protein [Bacteroidales bacterium]|nr:T9SS type A sorting domain-containing protein [Bacteroidales bacterium]
MKSIKYLSILIFTALFTSPFVTSAQTLDRITLSPGGQAGDSLNVTLGEVFVFTLSGGNLTLEGGTQGSNDNTGIITGAETVEDALWGTVLLFPNPVSDFLNFNIEGFDDGFLYIQIFDMSGKVVMTYNAVVNSGTYTLNVRDLPPSFYIFSAMTRNGTYVGNLKFSKI